MSHQRQRFQPPELYSISRGIVSRVESYGCFVKLHNSPVSGLVHISQLYSTKIDNVADVVSLDMEVFVKVIGVQVETIEDETTGRTRQRHKVKLSMKYVNQDTGQDLDPENENIENDIQRSSRGSGGGGGMSAGNVMDGTNGANSQLGQALSSNIGMSIAMDPGNLVLKGKRGAASSAINGYSLVGEDEGELEPAPIINNNYANHQESMMPVEQKVVRPMGRGRGTTLPAWMTRIDSEDKLGTMNALPSTKDDISRDSDRHRGKSRNDKHHRKERRSKKHHKKHKSRKHKDHLSRGGRSRSYSYSSYSSDSRSRSRSRSTERRSSKSYHKKKKSHKRHKRRRHRSRSRSRNSREEHSTSDFTNVDEARAIMQRLEKRRVEADS